jgi:hypothetical protein
VEKYILGLKKAGFLKTTSLIEEIVKNENLKKYDRFRNVIDEIFDCFLNESNKKFGKELTGTIYKLISFSWADDGEEFFTRVVNFLLIENKLKLISFLEYMGKDFRKLNIELQFCLLCSYFLLGYEIDYKEISDIFKPLTNATREEKEEYDKLLKKLKYEEPYEYGHIRNGIAHGRLFRENDKLRIIDKDKTETETYNKVYSVDELSKKVNEILDIRVCFSSFLGVIYLIRELKGKYNKLRD